MSGESTVKKSLKTGLFWTSGGQLLTVILSLGVNIVLARYIKPSDFGAMGIVMFFILLSDVLAKGGLAGALIRMKEVTRDDYSTVFVFNLVVSSAIYLILFLLSGYIAAFYESKVIRPLLLVSGLTIIVNAFQLINITNLIRLFKFKQRFIYQFSSTFFAGVISILMAYYGMGIWALALFPLSNSIFLTFILIYFEGFAGGVSFNKESFNRTYKFGVNTSLATLLDTIFENIYSLVLGRYFNLSQVGFLYQAQRLQKVPNNVLNSFSQRVLFPVLAQKQDDTATFNNLFSRVVTVFTVLVGMIVVLIFTFAEDIIVLLLGKDWLGSVFYLKAFIVASFFYMQEQFNRVIFKVYDQTNHILFLEILKKCVQLVTIFIGIYLENLEVLIWGFVLTSIFSFLINFYFSRKIISSKSMHLHLDLVARVVFIALCSSFIASYVFYIMQFDFLERLVSIPILVGLYFGMVFLFIDKKLVDFDGLIKFVKLK